MEGITLLNINPKSGISSDYKLSYGNISNFLERVDGQESPRTILLAKRTFLHRGKMKFYEQYFKDQGYKVESTEENIKTISKLNSIVEKIRKLQEDSTMASSTSEMYQDLKPLIKQLEAIINGTDSE